MRSAWNTRVAFGRVDRRRRTLCGDRPRDAHRMRLVAELAEDPRELSDTERGDDGARRLAARHIEAQVEAPAGADAEAALTVGELVG